MFELVLGLGKGLLIGAVLLSVYTHTHTHTHTHVCIYISPLEEHGHDVMEGVPVDNFTLIADQPSLNIQTKDSE